jgi:excisionase family DNA binding protein
MTASTEAVAQVRAAEPRMYTVKQTREITGLGNTTVYALLAAGHLKAKKCGSRTLVTGESIAAYLNGLPDAVLTTGRSKAKTTG